MAIKLEDKQNVMAPDSDYPYGNIKDDTGAGDGTPVNVAVYGDMHQFFAKMFALSGLTYNGLPDNEYSGFQYIEAATKLWKTYTGTKIISADAELTIDDIGKLIVVSGNLVDIVVYLPSSTDSQDGDSFTIVNYSAYLVTVVRKTPDAVRFEGSGGVKLDLPTIGDYSTFVADVANTDWYAINYRIKEVPTVSTVITQTTGGGFSETGTGATATFLFADEIKDVYNTYDNTTGKFTPNVAGWYEINVNSVFYIAASLTNYVVQFSIFKNGSLLRRLDERYPYSGSGEMLNLNGSYVFEANGTTDYFEIQMAITGSQTWLMKGNLTYKFIEE